MNYRIMTTCKLRKYKSSSNLQIHQMVWTLNQVTNTFLYQNEFDSSSVYVLGGKKVQKWQGRGRNKCKNVAKLKAGEKIEVMFYNNLALSKTFPRQLDRIVRDSNITPIRVMKWTDIRPAAQKHIFDAIKVHASFKNLVLILKHWLNI